MSVFVRPDSPPPRQPSPDITYTPLNPPAHSRSRRRPRLSMQPTSGRAVGPQFSERILHSMRSYDHISENAKCKRLANKQDIGSKSKSRGTPLISPPTTPRSLPTSSPPRSPSLSGKLGHRRSLSFAIPYRSPPPSPTIASPPPPVPPIPAFALNPTDKKPVLQRLPLQPIVTPIYLPDFDTISPVATSHRKQSFTARLSSGHGETGTAMTCAKFFSLRNANCVSSLTCAV